MVRCHDARLAREAQDRLSAAGVTAVALPGAPRPAPGGEDICFIPAASAGDAAAILSAMSDRFGALVGMPTVTPPRTGLDDENAPTCTVAIDAPPALLASQVAAYIRLFVVEDEQRRRAQTAHALGIPPLAPHAPRKLRALYIGAPSPVFLSLERALAGHGGLVAAAFSSYSGFDHLHDEVFDAVVLNGAQDPATAISLCAALRRNASLSHMPTMMVTASGDQATAKAGIERGASAVAEVNASSGASLGWLFEAIRRERRRAAAEHDLCALRDLMGDVRTGLFRRDAFDAHLARLASDHHASGRPLSLATLRMLPAHGAKEPAVDAWKAAFCDIANLAARLMRDADCGVAIGGDVIAVALPAADLQAARRMAERIASVAECTAFAAGEAEIGPLIFERSCVELQPGESGGGMLARALRAIEIESVPA